MREELKATFRNHVISRNEKTATVLSSVTSFLPTNPTIYNKAIEGIHEVVVLAEETTFATVADQCPYPNACLEQALRLYSPVSVILTRKTGLQGDFINGRFVAPCYAE